jgi:hypothetical protein
VSEEDTKGAERMEFATPVFSNGDEAMANMTGRVFRISMLVLLLGVLGRAADVPAVCDQKIATLSAGQLSISSAGCSLQRVMDAVKHVTGIEAVMPASAGSIRVFATLGPGQPARIVSSLLEDLPFNSRLIAKADGSGSLLRVELTEQLAPVVLSAADLKKLEEQKKASDAMKLASAADANHYESPTKRAELDDSTLNRLPALPPGVPSSMWALYPGIAATVADSGTLPSFPANASPAQGSPLVPISNGQGFQIPADPGAVPKGAIGLPQLPPGIDPNLGKLYPWNLMQLIQGGFKPNYLPVPPMAGPIPFTPPTPTGH